MLNRIRFFIIRLVIGKTPVIANVNFVGGVNVGETTGLKVWNNVIESIGVSSEVAEFTRA